MTIIEETLRKHGSKVTPGRVAILSVLREKCVPMSVVDISSSLSLKLNQTTIYRALEDLADSGVVKKIDLGHVHSHYEIIEGVPHHHHLVCSSCGKIEDVQICSPHELEKNALKQSKSFRLINRHALEFFGICEKCVKN